MTRARLSWISDQFLDDLVLDVAFSAAQNAFLAD
jgi:hypothetical protein